MKQLKGMSQAQLDALYKKSTMAKMPSGETRGRVLVFREGNRPLTARFLEFFWRGKIFDAKKKTLLNRIAGFNVAKAVLYFGKSKLDGKKCLVIDYSGSSNVSVRNIIDEIREVSSGVYLGRAYRNGIFTLYFALEKAQ